MLEIMFSLLYKFSSFFKCEEACFFFFSSGGTKCGSVTVLVTQ